MNKQEFKRHLIFENDFNEIADNILMYKDEVDTIIVQIFDNRVIVMASGRKGTVIPSYNDVIVDCGWGSVPWTNVLQVVLEKF